MADAAATATQLQSQLETPPTASAKSDPVLADLGKQIQGAMSEKIAPPEPVKYPELPKNPSVDAGQWQGLGMALIGMAMISGAHKGNWLAAGQFLNGAMQGYAAGNEELAKRSYEQFQAQMKVAQDEAKARNDQYKELLSDRSKSINELISQYRTMAAEDDRQDMLAASQTRSLVAMTNALMAHETAEQKIGMMNDKAHASLEPSDDVKALGDNLAWQYYYTGKTPPFGMGASPLRNAFLSSLEDIRKQLGMSAQEFGASVGTQHAQTHALNALGQKIAQLEPAESSALKNMDAAIASAQKLDPSQFPAVNKALLAGDIQTGDAQAVDYKMKLFTALREYAKVSSGNVGASGLTDSQIKEMDSQLSFSSSLPQLIAARNAMAMDMTNVMSSYRDQFNSVKDMAQTGQVTQPGVPQVQPQAGAAPPDNAGWSIQKVP